MANNSPRRQPTMQNIPIHTELGTEIRRGFLMPARGQSFVAFDFSQWEARLLTEQLAAQARRDSLWRDVQHNGNAPVRTGGTRKIAELPPPPCQHSQPLL